MRTNESIEENVRVIVLMSSYNGERYIEEQIDSILAQEGCSVELIVRDDGSSDGTKTILDDYAQKGLLNYYVGENIGPAHSFLTLIVDAPPCEYYAFADQDDIWLPEKLINGIMKIKDHDVPALYSSNMQRIDENTKVLEEVALPEEVKTDFMSVMTVSGRLFGCTMVFNKKMAEFVKKRNIPQYIIMHDLWLAMIASLHGSLVYDSNPSIRYRMHANSVTFSKNIPISDKIYSMFKGDKESVSRQCIEFVNYVGEEQIRKLEKWEICDWLLNYRMNLTKKIKLQFFLLRKSDMSFKLRIHRCVQILFGKY